MDTIKIVLIGTTIQKISEVLAILRKIGYDVVPCEPVKKHKVSFNEKLSRILLSATSPNSSVPGGSVKFYSSHCVNGSFFIDCDR